MRQIQQMTQVLNAILTQVLKLKKQGQEIEMASITNEMLTEELGLSLDDLLLFLEKKGISSFKKEFGFTNEHLSILVDLVYELAESGFDKPDQHEDSLSFFSKSLMLYEFIEMDERIYSIDRNLKITKIKDYLS